MVTEDAWGRPSSWSITVTDRQILCVRLKNWPIDRFRRRLRSRDRCASGHDSLCSKHQITNTKSQTNSKNEIQNSKRWLHQQWVPGPRPLRPAKKPTFIETALRSKPPLVTTEDPGPPLVLVRTVAAREIIVAASGSAYAKSI